MRCLFIACMYYMAGRVVSQRLFADILIKRKPAEAGVVCTVGELGEILTLEAKNVSTAYCIRSLAACVNVLTHSESCLS